MGPGHFGGPANAPIPVLLHLLIIVCCLTLAASSDCKVHLCSKQYSRALDEDNVVESATYRYCSLLKSYNDCMEATGRSCRGNLGYHSFQTLISNWAKTYNCESVLLKGPQPSRGPNRPSGGHRFQKPPRQHQECNSYRPASVAPVSYSHCALFGDPHLRTFYDELQTCSVSGAWPLLDNPHLAVQVTNEPVGKGSSATAITKVTVIIRQHSPCAQEKTYEAQSDYLPGVFPDGSKWSGPGVRIREEVPGKHIEIHLRYIATKIVIRQVGNYLTFAAKMPSTVAVQGAQGETLELCVKGCPRREIIDFENILDPKSGPKQEAIAACRALNITDFYLDACVFDLLTTGDGSFSAAARDAMLDAGPQSVVNGSLAVIPRGLASSAALSLTSVVLHIIIGIILVLLQNHLVR
ncbi:repulsive guidance molecule A [Parasteatoda tepidariorum]|uniref:repulsive guidance molecule A n=1 Tax=Parasteatoda tepidariorum TaxID=114398 RepID=UPI000A2C0826|nr:repulsive guidance molecule A [Parasteatoda tepidariorum]